MSRSYIMIVFFSLSSLVDGVHINIFHIYVASEWVRFFFNSSFALELYIFIFNFTRILYVRFVVINDGNAQWFDIREFPKCLSSFFFLVACFLRGNFIKFYFLIFAVKCERNSTRADTKCRLKVSRSSWNKKIDFLLLI